MFKKSFYYSSIQAIQLKWICRIGQRYHLDCAVLAATVGQPGGGSREGGEK